MALKQLFRVGRSRTGLGLFAIESIEKRTIIVQYRGRRIPTKEARKYERRHASKYMFEVDERWTIDGSARRNIARYANHSCRPNAESVLIAGRLVLRAIKAIRIGEEISFDYGREYFDLFIKPKGCQCTKCRTR